MSSLRTEDDLRTLFAEDAEDVCTSAEMVSRIAVRRRQRSWWPAVAACAAVAAVAVIVVALTSGGTNKRPTPPVANTVPGNWRTVSYPVWRVAVQAPPDWRSYQYSVSAEISDLVGYLSTATLHDPCVRTASTTACDQPIARLAPDDVLVGWWVGALPHSVVSGVRGGQRTVLGGRAAVVTTKADDRYCADIGGRTSLTASIGDSRDPDSHVAYTMAACLGRDADQSAVFTMLRTVRFNTHPPSATIRGSLLAVGGPAPGTAHPLPGTVILRSPGSEITVPVGKGGHYSAEVPPGTYEIDGHSPLYGNGKYLCRALRAATPGANETTTANVYCQYA